MPKRIEPNQSGFLDDRDPYMAKSHVSRNSNMNNMNKSSDRPSSGMSNNARQGLHAGGSRPTRMGLMRNQQS